MERYALDIIGNNNTDNNNITNSEEETKNNKTSDVETKTALTANNLNIAARSRSKSSLIGIGANTVIDKEQPVHVLIDLLHGAPKSGPILHCVN